MVYWKSRNERWGLHVYITDGWTKRRFRKIKSTATEIWPGQNHVSVTRGLTWMNVMITITTPR